MFRKKAQRVSALVTVVLCFVFSNGSTANAQLDIIDSICRRQSVTQKQGESCTVRIFPVSAKQLSFPSKGSDFDSVLSGELTLSVALSKLQRPRGSIWLSAPNAIVLGDSRGITVMPFAFTLTQELRQHSLKPGDFIATMHLDRGISDPLAEALKPDRGTPKGNRTVRSAFGTDSLLKSPKEHEKAIRLNQLENESISSAEQQLLSKKTPVLVVYRTINNLTVRYVVPTSFAGVFSQGDEPGALMRFMAGVRPGEDLDQDKHDKITQVFGEAFSSFQLLLVDGDVVESTFLQFVPPLVGLSN